MTVAVADWLLNDREHTAERKSTGLFTWEFSRATVCEAGRFSRSSLTHPGSRTRGSGVLTQTFSFSGGGSTYHRRQLHESDYLLGVFDGSRMGALRFKTGEEGDFLDNDASMATPPWTSLRQLEEASLNLEDAEQTQQSRWLMMLVAPVSSLGGARPKANVLDRDGSLWIAKFPSRKDRRDIGAWFHLLPEGNDICGVVSAWSRLADGIGLPRADQEMMGSAFRY